MPTPNQGESKEEYMKRCILIVMGENAEMKNDQAYAICLSKFEKGADSVMRKIGFDAATIDDKIIRNDDEWLVMPIVIASEIVQQYDDGWWYKPASELEKMALNAELVGAKPIKILSHPTADTNYLLQKQIDVSGKATNFRYVKNLIDPKTQRPCRKGVLSDGWWSKRVTPENVIDDLVKLKMRDCSIGFTFDPDMTAGEWEGKHYDGIQTNIYLDHVAAPIPAGRCPGPICGIGFDARGLIAFDEAKERECPVCKRIREVGFATAGKRLYGVYGPDVLEVIEGNPLPKIEVAKTSLDEDFNRAFKDLSSKLPEK